MSEESPWGKIIPSGFVDEEEEDPIKVLVKKVEEIKKELYKKKRTVPLTEEEVEKKKAEISALEKEIYDRAKIKKQKGWFKK